METGDNANTRIYLKLFTFFPNDANNINNGDNEQERLPYIRFHRVNGDPELMEQEESEYDELVLSISAIHLVMCFNAVSHRLKIFHQRYTSLQRFDV